MRGPADPGHADGSSGQPELTDHDALEVRADRTRRAASAFMRIGDRPTTIKLGVVPGVLPGIGLVLALVIAVGAGAVASTALGGGSSGSTGSPATTSGSSRIAVASPSATPSVGTSASASASASATGCPTASRSASPSPSVSASSASASLGSTQTIPVEFRFTSSAQGWTASRAATGNSSFSPSYDASFGHIDDGGSLAATTTAGCVSRTAGGAWVWTGTWVQLLVPAGMSVVSVTASYDIYVNSFSGSGVSSVRCSMDFAGPGGPVLGRVVPKSQTAAVGTWLTRTGTAYPVPAAYQSASSRVSFVLNAHTDGVGGASWHIDRITLTTAFR